MLTNLIYYGRKGRYNLQALGSAGLFLGRVLCQPPSLKRIWQDLRYQFYFLGVLSGLIIVVSALFIGMVIGLQGYHTLQKFGAASQLGQLLALSISRELSPVMTAILFAGRAGSALTAEIGLMQATEQLDSMEMMGVDPLKRIVYPRLLAAILVLPVLTVIFSVTAIYGGYFIGVSWLGVDPGSFWTNMQAAVNFRIDVLSGIIKSIIFGIVISWIAVFQGFYCQANAEAISQATTKTVVYSALAILILDFMLTATMIGAW